MDVFVRSGRKYGKLLLELRKEKAGGVRYLDVFVRSGEYGKFLLKLWKEAPGCRVDVFLRSGK